MSDQSINYEFLYDAFMQESMQTNPAYAHSTLYEALADLATSVFGLDGNKDGFISVFKEVIPEDKLGELEARWALNACARSYHMFEVARKVFTAHGWVDESIK